jgi:hypothetical protein
VIPSRHQYGYGFRYTQELYWRLRASGIAQEASMIELGKNDGMAADHPAIKQLHVRPAPGLALLTVMAICTAASVFASFGVLVWWLVF